MVRWKDGTVERGFVDVRRLVYIIEHQDVREVKVRPYVKRLK